MVARRMVTVSNEIEIAREHRDVTRELRARATMARLQSERLRHQTRAFSLQGIAPSASLDGAASRTRPVLPERDGDAARPSAELQQAQATVEHLRAALATRDLIWEAKLIIAAAVGCDAEEAHQLLMKQSQHENRKMRDVAASIVHRSSPTHQVISSQS